MGGWKLEIAKMGMYMMFPVGLFYYFNQAEYFEEWMVKTRRELFPPENKMHKKEIEDCIRKVHMKREQELLKLLEEEEMKGKV